MQTWHINRDTRRKHEPFALNYVKTTNNAIKIGNFVEPENLKFRCLPKIKAGDLICQPEKLTTKALFP